MYDTLYIIWFSVEPHKTATLSYDFTCEVLQLNVIQHWTKCYTLMCVNQWSLDKSYVEPPILWTKSKCSFQRIWSGSKWRFSKLLIWIKNFYLLIMPVAGPKISWPVRYMHRLISKCIQIWLNLRHAEPQTARMGWNHMRLKVSKRVKNEIHTSLWERIMVPCQQRDENKY